MVPVSQETKDAVSRLSGALGAIELPSTRRELTVAEQRSLINVGADAKKVVRDIEKVVEKIKGAVFNDFDVRLEKEGSSSGLPTNDKGHYVVEQELTVEGTDKKFVRQVAEHSPKLTAASLKQLWTDGKISRATYYRLTKAVEVPREIDEDALLVALKANPELASKIAPAIEPGKLVASFWIKDVGEDS
jgi:hypothetical protein